MTKALPKRPYAAQRRTRTPVASAPTAPAVKLRHYDPRHDHAAPASRPGAEDALRIPSRMGNTRRYRDGRVETLEV